MRVTVDASVAVKWFIVEDHREEARSLLATGIGPYAPDLLPVECASVIWKKVPRREIASATPYPPPNITDAIAELWNDTAVVSSQISSNVRSHKIFRVPVQEALMNARMRRKVSQYRGVDQGVLRLQYMRTL